MNSLPQADDLFEHAACGLLMTDTDGTIQLANATFCHWLGYDVSELKLKRRIQDLFTMGGRIFHHTHWIPLLQKQGSIGEVQMDLIRRNGEILPTLINVVRRRHRKNNYDEIAIFIATNRQQYERELLLARKTAEDSLSQLQLVQQKLQQSRDVLGIAMRGAKMGVWSHELATNSIWWSHELESLVGMEEGSFAGSDEAFYNLLHADDRERVTAAITTAIKTATDFVVEFRLRHVKGEWIPMEARGCASYNQAHKPLTLFGVVIDISERKNVEAKLRQLNDKLSLADRRKDEFLATLAHELRNPLAPVRNVLEVLKLKDIDDPQVRWARAVIERQVRQMTHLIDDLMEVSRITQGRLELRKKPLNLVDVIQHAVETSRGTIDSHEHQLTIDVPDERIIVSADETRLTQIVSNLLTNAAKYTPRGGQISLHLEKRKDDVILQIRDNGIGIPREHLSSIFEMFSQLTPAIERSQGGLGIGLALVRGLVELHNGTIFASSPGIGKGSKFTLRLPLCKLPSVYQPRPDRETATATSGRRVLVVDDNIDAAESLSTALSMLGHTTCTAHDGLSCLDLAESFCPEVILLDIGLPDISGYEAAIRLREQPWGKGILLVAATGWGQAQDKEQAKLAGFDKHLTKPIDFSELNNILSL